MRTILVISTESFSENIRALRNGLGWSKAYFCQYFDMEPRMLERIESGDYMNGLDIYLDSFQNILKLSGMDQDLLIYGKNIPTDD